MVGIEFAKLTESAKVAELAKLAVLIKLAAPLKFADLAKTLACATFKLKPSNKTTAIRFIQLQFRVDVWLIR